MSSGYIIEKSHGGHCCGMSHLYMFPRSPSFRCDMRKKQSDEEFFRYLKKNPHLLNAVNDEYPAQTAEERVRAVIEGSTYGIGGIYREEPRQCPIPGCSVAHPPGRVLDPPNQFIRAARPNRIFEIVLVNQAAENWKPVLLAMGFKIVNEAPNSNSGNMMIVFHLNTGDYIRAEAKTETTPQK